MKDKTIRVKIKCYKEYVLFFLIIIYKNHADKINKKRKLVKPGRVNYQRYELCC